MATLAATLTKYKNLSYEDSSESIRRFEVAKEMGVGNETVKEVKKSDFDNISSALQRANILARGERIEMSDDGFVVMPVSLLNKAGLEVRISDALR